MPYIEDKNNDKIFPWKGAGDYKRNYHYDTTAKYPYGKHYVNIITTIIMLKLYMQQSMLLLTEVFQIYTNVQYI